MSVLPPAVVGASEDLRLVHAARSGNREAVRSLLREGVDVNLAQGDGATALHWAAYRDDVDLVDLLVRGGARVDVPNDFGVTPLHLACENGNAAIVKKLLLAGTNPNVTLLASQVTPLMVAARVGSVGAVRALLMGGANVNAKEAAREQTALMWAAAQNHPEVVRVLVEAGADVHARSTVSRAMVSRGNNKGDLVGSRRGQHIAEMPMGGYTPLLFAARQGDVESLRILLVAGAKVDDPAPDGATPLVVAAHSDQEAAAAFLVEKGAAPNAAEAGYTALHAAVLRGNASLAKILLARAANPNAPLTKGSLTKRHGKSFTFHEGWVGASPLFLAAQFAAADIMRLLIDGGADPLFSLRGTTVLMAAAGVGVGGIAAELSAVHTDRHSRRLDPGEVELALVQDEDERSVMNSGLKAVQLALEHHVDVNAVNEAGDTALHGAAGHGFNSVVRLLVDAGAKVAVKNQEGLTPFAVATARGRKGTAELLRKRSVRWNEFLLDTAALLWWRAGSPHGSKVARLFLPRIVVGLGKSREAIPCS